MLLTVLWILGIGFAFYVINIYRKYVRNIAEVKTTGLPYFGSPAFPNNFVYQLCSPLIHPLAQKLPRSWTGPWPELRMDWAQFEHHATFKKLGTDTFFAVSPERIVLYTADASVIDQISTRRNDFPKALEVYGMLKIYGSNVVCEEV